MKIVYIGEKNGLSAAIIGRLKKEDHEVYFLRIGARRETMPHRKEAYREYDMPAIDAGIRRLLEGIAPESVIYEGREYGSETWEEDQNENLVYLMNILEACGNCRELHVILLSSTEVYGKSDSKVTEETSCCPETRKGRILLQEENMVDFYQRICGFSAAKVRISDVYANDLPENGKDVFGKLIRTIRQEKCCSFSDRRLQPIHCLDVADAMVRIIDSRKTGVFNLCGSAVIMKSQLAEKLAELIKSGSRISVLGEQRENGFISNERMKRELEWSEFWEMGSLLRDCKITVIEAEKGSKGGKGRSRGDLLPPKIRQTLENLAIFLFLFMIYACTNHHSLFSKMDWLLIYIVIISAVYGLKQSILSVILSSIVYLLYEGNLFWKMTNFYSYAENLLILMEFLFLGIITGYAVDRVKEEKQLCIAQRNELQEKYYNLKEINDKNVLVKQEYERRILNTKNGLPYLYSLFQRLFVYDANRILPEAMNIVKELTNTETVAVYGVMPGTSCLKLMDAFNEESVIEGDTLDLKRYPKMERAIRNRELYEGDIWKGEPAVVLPIEREGSCNEVIVIKTLPFEMHSLDTINQLRTVSKMISASLEKNLEYKHNDQ